jgi:N-acyl-D-aspartate/D-glutamate deacylase
LKLAYPPEWGKLMPEIGEHVAAARARGLEITGDLYVYTAGGTSLDTVVPSWAHDGGLEAMKQQLKDPAVRARLKREQIAGSTGWWNIIEACGGWSGIVLTKASNAANAKYENKSIAEIGKEMGKDPADAAFDLIEQGEGENEGQTPVSIIVHMMDESDVKTALKFSWTSIGSDSGVVDLTKGAQDDAHPRAFGNFPRVIARYVRDDHVLTLEEAIHKMTGWPSAQYRLAGRGVIREGQWADVTIFDYDTLQDRGTFDKPAVFPTGISYVLVNGQVVMDHGTHTGIRPGAVLYGPGYVSTGAAQ